MTLSRSDKIVPKKVLTKRKPCGLNVSLVIRACLAWNYSCILGGNACLRGNNISACELEKLASKYRLGTTSIIRKHRTDL